jgi:hypothetical protein
MLPVRLVVTIATPELQTMLTGASGKICPSFSNLKSIVIPIWGKRYEDKLVRPGSTPSGHERFDFSARRVGAFWITGPFLTLSAGFQ